MFVRRLRGFARLVYGLLALHGFAVTARWLADREPALDVKPGRVDVRDVTPGQPLVVVWDWHRRADCPVTYRSWTTGACGALGLWDGSLDISPPRPADDRTRLELPLPAGAKPGRCMLQTEFQSRCNLAQWVFPVRVKVRDPPTASGMDRP